MVFSSVHKFYANCQLSWKKNFILHSRLSLDQQAVNWELWEHSLVQDEHHCVVLRNWAAEVRFEQPVRADGLSDVASEAVLAHQLGRLEPTHILRQLEGEMRTHIINTNSDINTTC